MPRQFQVDLVYAERMWDGAAMISGKGAASPRKRSYAARLMQLGRGSAVIRRALPLASSSSASTSLRENHAFQGTNPKVRAPPGRTDSTEKWEVPQYAPGIETLTARSC